MKVVYYLFLIICLTNLVISKPKHKNKKKLKAKEKDKKYQSMHDQNKEDFIKDVSGNNVVGFQFPEFKGLSTQFIEGVYTFRIKDYYSDSNIRSFKIPEGYGVVFKSFYDPETFPNDIAFNKTIDFGTIYTCFDVESTPLYFKNMNLEIKIFKTNKFKIIDNFYPLYTTLLKIQANKIIQAKVRRKVLKDKNSVKKTNTKIAAINYEKEILNQIKSKLMTDYNNISIKYKVLYNRYKLKFNSTITDLEQANNDLSKIDVKIKSIELQRQGLYEKIMQNENDVTLIQGIQIQSNKDIANQEKNITNNEIKLNQLRESVDSLFKDKGEELMNLDKLNEENLKTENDVKNLKTLIEKYKELILFKENKIKTNKKKIDEIKNSKLQKINKQINQAQDSIKEVTNFISKIKISNKKIKNEIKEYSKKVDQLGSNKLAFFRTSEKLNYKYETKTSIKTRLLYQLEGKILSKKQFETVLSEIFSQKHIIINKLDKVRKDIYNNAREYDDKAKMNRELQQKISSNLKQLSDYVSLYNQL